jgi:argininosuccinate lyase
MTNVAEMKKFSPHFDDDVAKILDVRRSLAQRRAIGAPSPENIAAQTKRWKAKLQSLPCGKRGAGV